MLKILGRVSLVLVMLLILSASMNTSIVRALPQVSVATDSTAYSIGDPVRIGILLSSDMGAATVKMRIDTPAGSVSYDLGTISSAVWHYTTLTGLTVTTGTYNVEVDAMSGDVIWTGSTIFYVQGPPFDFAMTVSPPTQTITQGGTANFQILITYSSQAYSGTIINIVLSGLGAGMDHTVSSGGGLTILTSENTPPATYSIIVTGSAGGGTHQASVTLTVTPKFDFSVSISPTSQTVTIGDKTSYSVTVSLVSGTAAPVSLTASGLPGDVTFSFSPQTGIPTFTSTLTVDASAATSEGGSTITVMVSSGKISRTATATLVVKKEDFALSASPNMTSVRKGQKASFNLNVKPIGGFNQPVTFTVSGLPSGASSTFTVPSGKPPFTSELAIDVSSSTPVGNYSLAIDVAGGGKSHSLTVTLTVEKKISSLEISVDHGLIGDVTVSGHLKPSVKNAEVVLSYHGPEGKEMTRKATVDTDGAFKDALSPDPSGNWTVAVKWAGNDEYEGSSSQMESFTSQKGINLEMLLSFPYFIIPVVVAAVIVSAIAVTGRRRRAKSRIVQPSVKANICSRCGTAVTPGDLFCPNCGSSVGE
jgi:hypothetical protein